MRTLVALGTRAHGHACQEFADALAEVHSWEPERFDMDLVLLQELECCVRATVARGKEKLALLDRLPYLVCRLDSGASVAQRALDQFGEVPEQHHHRLSMFFPRPGQHVQEGHRDPRSRWRLGARAQTSDLVFAGHPARR